MRYGGCKESGRDQDSMGCRCPQPSVRESLPPKNLIDGTADGGPGAGPGGGPAAARQVVPRSHCVHRPEGSPSSRPCTHSTVRWRETGETTGHKVDPTPG